MQSFLHTEASRTVDSYRIDLRNLEEGLHKWVYDLDEKFFKMVSEEEVRDGRVHVEMELKRCAMVFDLHFTMNGMVVVSCDRCLDDMTQEIETKTSLIVKMGQAEGTEEEDILTVSESEGGIDLAWYLYESIVLALPMQRRHAEGDCNNEMLHILEAHSAHHSNEETGGDPRWDALKGLIGNNNN